MLNIRFYEDEPSSTQKSSLVTHSTVHLSNIFLELSRIHGSRFFFLFISLKTNIMCLEQFSGLHFVFLQSLIIGLSIQELQSDSGLITIPHCSIMLLFHSSCPKYLYPYNSRQIGGCILHPYNSSQEGVCCIRITAVRRVYVA